MRYPRICLILIAAALSACDDADDPAERQLVANALGKLEFSSNWDHIDINKATKNDYVLTLTYRDANGPVYRLIARADTLKIARVVLTELVAVGRRPASDRASLWVWAESPAGKGETGANLIYPYGSTRYNPSSDSFDFKPE
jgi:hypothetical protein